MAYKLTEVPDYVPAYSGGLNDEDTSAATKEAVACETNFCLRYHSSALSFKLPSPVENTATLYQFHSSIRERLSKCSESNKYYDNELQLNLWPIITTGSHSVSVIGPKGSGKTTAYVLYLLNRFRLSGYLQAGVTADQMAAKGSPLFQPQRICGSKFYAIILTDSMRSVASIGSEFTKWLRILLPQPKTEAEEQKKAEATEEEGNFDRAAALRRRQAQRNQYSIRVNLLHEKSPLVDYFDVMNGCAVLVSTAAALTKLIRMQFISLNDNQVLIIDHADEFINSASKDVVDLFELTGSPRYDFYSNRQTMIFARHWTPNMSKYFFEVQHKPTLVLSSLFDATIIFKQATAKIELCRFEDSTEEALLRVISSELLCSERLLLELGNVAIYGAVICKNYAQIESLKARLDSSKCIDTERFRPFALKESATEAEMNRLSVDLLTADTSHTVKLVLLTTEDIFSFSIYFRKFNCLLHLDQRFDQYRDLSTALNYRFLLAYDLFIGASGQTADEEEKFQVEQLDRLKRGCSSGLGKHHILNYFFLSQSEHSGVQEERFRQTVVNLLEYCGHLDNSTATFMNQNIADYIQMNIECNICPQFAAFAKCKARDKGLKCWKGRHTLTRRLADDISSLKKIAPNSQIYFKITHVEEPNQFFIHLLAYRSEEQADGKWTYTEHCRKMERVKTILEKYSNRQDRRRVIWPLTIDHVYLLQTTDALHRVQLQRIHPLTGAEDLPIWLNAVRAVSLTDEQLTFFRLTVTVFSLDTGRTITTKAFNLLALDAADAAAIDDIAPLAYRVYLPEVAPLEGAYTWHSMFSSKLGALCTDSFLLQMEGAKEENITTGWILAACLPTSPKDTATTLWLHRVIMAKRLRFVGVYNYVNLAEDMIGREVAVANKCTFPGCDYEAHTRVSAIWKANSKIEDSQKAKLISLAIEQYESSDEDEKEFWEPNGDSDSDEPKEVNGELVDTDSDEDSELITSDAGYDLQNENSFITNFDRQMLHFGLNYNGV